MTTSLQGDQFLSLDLISDFHHSYLVDQGLISKKVLRGVTPVERSFPTSKKLTNDPMAMWWRNFLDNEDKHSFPIQSIGDRSNREISYIDLFSSVGGLSLGLEESIKSLGYRPLPLLAVDVDEGALAIHKFNHGTKRVIHDSVASLVDFKVIGQGAKATLAYEPEMIGSQLQDLVGKVDVVLAGPPCQGHSTLNNHSRGDDPRNLLYLTVPAIAIALKVPIVIIENVPNVLNDVDNVVESTREILLQNGYQVTGAVLAAHQLGWAQTRRRYFLIATLGHLPVDLDLVSKYFAHQPAPVSWALDKFKVSTENSNHIMNQIAEMSSLNQKRIDWLFDNDAYELPNHIRPDCHKDGHTYPSVYGRMKWTDPAPTLTTGFVSPGRGRFIHPKERRVLTPREAARLQGFPNWFDFSPAALAPSKRGQLAKWIGDAVPSILGYVAGFSGLINYLEQD
jgi:DNA (cytosine-5)-methyltransferase 1